MEELDILNLYLNSKLNDFFKKNNLDDEKKLIIQKTKFIPIFNDNNSYFIFNNELLNINWTNNNNNYKYINNILSCDNCNDKNNVIKYEKIINYYGIQFKINTNVNIIINLTDVNGIVNYGMEIKDNIIFVIINNKNIKIKEYEDDIDIKIYFKENKILYIINNIVIYDIDKNNNNLYLEINILSDNTNIYNLIWIIYPISINNIEHNSAVKYKEITNNIKYNKKENYLIKNIDNNIIGEVISESIIFKENENIGFQFNINTDNKNIRIGIKNINNLNNNINYCLELNNQKQLIVYENNILKYIIGKYKVNDNIIINIVKNNNIEYIRNNILLYSNKILKNNCIFVIEMFFIDYKSKISNILWITKNINYNYPINYLVKFTDNNPNYIIHDKNIYNNNCIDWDNGVTSEEIIKFNNNINNISGFEFNILSKKQKGIIGFGKQKKKNFENIKNIEFGILFLSNMRIMIYELNGLFKLHIGGYKYNDKFQIRLNHNNEIEYIKNNFLLYTSNNLIVNNVSYYIDLYMYDKNFQLKNVKWITNKQYNNTNIDYNCNQLNFPLYNNILQDNLILSENFIKFNNDINFIWGFEFIIMSYGYSGIIGLNSIDNNDINNDNNIDYSIYILNNRLLIYENLEIIEYVGGYSINDKFQIRLGYYNIEYLKNNTLLYISKKNLNYKKKYLIQISILDKFLEINNIRWIEKKNYLPIIKPIANELINFTSLDVNIIYSSNNLKKILNNSWITSAISEKDIDLNSKNKKILGFEFSIVCLNKTCIIGFSIKNRKYTSCFINIEYGIYLLDTNDIMIYENTAAVGVFGKYKKNDIFQIRYDELTDSINYIQNNTLLYISFNKCKYNVSYIVDVNLYDIDCEVSNFKWISINEFKIIEKKYNKNNRYCNIL